jgi:hypothetical protein
MRQSSPASALGTMGGRRDTVFLSGKNRRNLFIKLQIIIRDLKQD